MKPSRRADAVGTVCRMPGVACDFYVSGHCLYEEELNPGLDESFHCTEIVRIVAAYEELMNRADGFNLSGDKAFNVIFRLMEGVPPAGSACEEYRPEVGCRGCGGCAGEEDDGAPESIDCTHSLGGLCILRLPACEGVCRRFRFRTEQPSES
ncbi:hypothetical protein [Oleidesulfovibrio alaskensis]|uniref:hypothetical protein n=1 Tax=Oleidesulfovibrio alaskensis TaxID=58180 RepID=UPI0004827A79|nr:hypothetical protein [Oleidesulfovibrio alaskensis]